jgi:hypothetical protein
MKQSQVLILNGSHEGFMWDQVQPHGGEEDRPYKNKPVRFAGIQPQPSVAEQ